MGKKSHPHKVMFFDKRVWKCVLPGCSFFVHSGLIHVLYGKHAICWQCGEIFIIDENSLREDQPRCFDCKTGKAAQEKKSKLQAIFDRHGVNRVEELPASTKQTLRALGMITEEEETREIQMEEDKPKSEYIPPVDEVTPRIVSLEEKLRKIGLNPDDLKKIK